MFLGSTVQDESYCCFEEVLNRCRRVELCYLERVSAGSSVAYLRLMAVETGPLLKL